jgi:hypothetical protein
MSVIHIFDAIGLMSEEVHRRDAIDKLKSRIRKVGTRCGDCTHWTKSSQCPQERNVNGQQRGPSFESFICGQFSECPRSKAFRAELQTELKELENTK